MATQKLISRVIPFPRRHPGLMLIGAAALALALITACASNGTIELPTARLAETTAPLSRLRLCTSSTSAYQLPAWYAFEKGLFAKYGLNVELVPMENGQLAATALITGQADACQLAGSNVLNAALAGEDLVLIGGLYNKHVYSLIVNPEIKQASDLKGKTVAVNQIGTATDTALSVALKQFGLKRDADVTVLPIGSATDAFNALLAGRVSGAMLNAPQVFKAQDLGYHELLDLATLPVAYQHLGIAVNRQMLRQRHTDTLNLMRAISHAMVAVRQDPESAKQVIAKYTKLDPQKDAEILDKTYQVVVQRQMAQLPYPTIEAVQALIDLTRENNPKAADFKAERLVDASIIQELEQSGFLSNLTK
jgi:NitT/TauT family transport system substrate-binding protein